MTGTTIAYASTCLSVSSAATAAEVRGDLSTCGVGVSGGTVDARNVQWGNDHAPGINGNPTVSGTGVTFYPWVGAPTPAPLTSAPNVTTSTVSGKCPDYLFLGLRGSGESGNNNLGPKVASLYAGLKTQWVNNDTIPADATFGAIGIQYEANPVPIFGTTGRSAWENLNDVENYAPGAWQGAVMLIAQMEDSVDECGATGQKIVLGGYSQGAWVIHAALAYLAQADPSLLSHVAAVGLIADPLRSTILSFQNEGTAQSHDGVATTYVGFAGVAFTDFVRNSILGDTFPDLPKVSMSDFSYPSTLVSKTADLCDWGDSVCDTSSFLGFPAVLAIESSFSDGVTIHGAYTDTEGKDLGAKLRALASR